jgi:hypothetical protein
MDVQCGGLCGHGTTYVMQKVAGKWKRYQPPMTTKLVKRKGEKGGTQTYDVIWGESLTDCYWNY